ncbi:hypothetical protein BN1097_350019 [Clostridioides difficile]|uniref:Uncharacterized protein n=1 Tax=Clostridioides difficile TaxID=1496 RepID=A0A069A637_CLODI|nr:hypothetical protein BN1097_350019 [Clostridioides difficile]
MLSYIQNIIYVIFILSVYNFYFSRSIIKYINKNRVVQKLNLNLEQLY